MSEEKGHEILIIRRGRSGDHGHHGGAWKIAFADFMTAMMALFLVLWLISATNEKTKASLARYFNPVKLVDMTVQKRGLHDPSERSAEDADTELPPPSRSKTDKKEPAAAKTSKPKGASAVEFPPTHSEGALFRDPYAVLAEIAAAGPGNKQPEGTDGQNVGAAANFQDPFQAGAPEVPQTRPPESPPSMPSDQSAADETAPLVPPASPSAAPLTPPAAGPGSQAGAGNMPPPAVPGSPPMMAQSAQNTADQTNEVAQTLPKKAAPAVQSQAAQDDQQARGKQDKKGETKEQPPSAELALAERIQNEIAGALGTTSSSSPAIRVKPTPQGVLISLTDDVNYAMFAIGSAEPQKRTVQIMEKVANVLKKAPGKIVISGHTDGRQYKSRNYDNWRLSQARAQMALYMLIRGGLEETRVEKIEGDADHDLKVPSDPYAAENRRIEILLRTKKP